MNYIPVMSKTPNLIKELRCLLPNITFKSVGTETDEEFKKSEIIIADFDLLKPHVYSLTNTKWVQGTWAGIDKIINNLDAQKPLPFIITRFSGIHFGRIMAEYVVTNIVNHERNMFEVYENNKRKLWSKEGNISEHRVISDLTIGILGIGSIGNHVGKTLHSFGAKIWGFGRRGSLPESPEYSHIEKYCTIQTLPNLLEKCDYIVSVLPNTSETTGLLNGNVLKHCAGKKTVFMNIGRGNIIKEKDLINAIENKWLSSAILDVFENEPLPENSELWSCPKIFITPHVSGVSRAKDIAEHFAENLKRFQNGEELPNKLIVGNAY